MTNRFKEFLKLHQEEEPLLIGNAWDVESAKAFEQSKFKAVATSSAAVAKVLGYEDDGKMPFEDYCFLLRRMSAFLTVPFSVDMEGGYAEDPEEICRNIKTLSEIGACGINLEDSVVNNGSRTIVGTEAFAKKLTEICRLLKNVEIDMFINVRSDSFLLELPGAIDDALSRLKAFEHTGAHGLFFPCVTNIADIQKLTAASSLPIHVLSMPALPSFKDLQKSGVKRISFGSSLNTHLNKYMDKILGRILDEQSFSALF